MVITKLDGGLGNQMFQYVAGRMLASLRGEKLYTDRSAFLYLARDPKITSYVYALDVFPNLVESAALPWHLGTLLPAVVPQIAPIWHALYEKYHLGRTKIIREKNGLTYDPMLAEESGDLYLLGFWQHYRYPKKIEQLLRKEFVFRSDIEQSAKGQLAHIPKKRRVSLHVRRGDYLSIGLGACTLAYYKKAVRRIEKHVHNPHYVVVSNDPGWAKEHLTFLKHVTFIEPVPKGEAIDMCLISQCSHHIIANSTFSWWGAWLNPDKEKIVIAPKPWFDWKEFRGKSPNPPEWIQMLKA